FLDQGRGQFSLCGRAALTPLGRPPFRVAAAGEAFVGGRRAAGVEVFHPDHRDVRLFFDAKTRRLVKLEARRRAGSREVVQELYFSEHREANGVWWARRMVILWDRQPHFELAITELELADKLEEKLFTRP